MSTKSILISYAYNETLYWFGIYIKKPYARFQYGDTEHKVFVKGRPAPCFVNQALRRMNRNTPAPATAMTATIPPITIPILIPSDGSSDIGIHSR